MPWPGHYHLEWGGKRGAFTDEIWQNGVRLAKRETEGETVPIGDEPFEAGDTLEEVLIQQWSFAVRNWVERETSWIAVDCLLDWISASWVLPSGAPDRSRSMRLLYGEGALGDAHAEYHPRGQIHGGGLTETTHPYQVAAVIGWRSDVRSTGPGSQGRIYSPAPCMDVGLGSGLIRLEVRESMASSASTLIEQLRWGNAIFGDRRFASIVTPRSTGLRSRIDEVVVDGRLDVLRKRAAKQRPEVTVHRVDHDLFDG